jgi:type I restriction-modification system DNA methylase subunit
MNKYSNIFGQILQIFGGSFSIERFYEIQYRLGSISVITNTDLNAKEVYELLKGRLEIEQSFDTLKNLLHADRVYMKLREAELLKKYSVKDLIIHLRRIYKLKIDNKWVTSEIPKTSRKIIEKLNFNLHIT